MANKKMKKSAAKKPTASQTKKTALKKKPASAKKSMSAKKATAQKPASAKKAVPAKKAASKNKAKSVPKKSMKAPAKSTKPQVKASTKAAKPVAAAAKAKVDYTKAITPLGQRLVVRRVADERVTAGGLIIPDSANMVAGFTKAEVLAVGAGGKNKKGMLRPLDVQVGDQVLFATHAGIKVQFNSEDLQIINETDVMGIVQN